MVGGDKPLVTLAKQCFLLFGRLHFIGHDIPKVLGTCVPAVVSRRGAGCDDVRRTLRAIPCASIAPCASA